MQKLLRPVWPLAFALVACTSAPAGTPRALVEEILPLLRQHYILEERVPEIEEALQRGLESGAFDGLDPTGLAEALTQELRSASGDLHFGVRAPQKTQAPQEEGKAGPNPAPAGSGILPPETLEGNVGYLEVRAFVDPALAAAEVDAAFAALAGKEALIIDLRQSRGGHPSMVAYLSSYLFEGESFLLNRIHWRDTDTTLEFWTRDDLPSPRFTGPVLILTSAATPSAAEGFTYHLKHLGRARVVGETSAGAAHPTQIFFLEFLDGSWLVAIPTGRAINPQTGTNWEGVGVVPHIEAPAAEALEVAHRLALSSLGR